MSRQSLRKVKLTSKFEEFSTSRLGSIQRLAHPTPPPQQEQTNQNDQEEMIVEATPTLKEKVATPKVFTPKVITPKVEREPPVTKLNDSIQKQQHHEPTTPLPKLTANGKIRGRPRKCWQKAETVVKPMSSTREELLRLREENATLKSQLEQMTVEFEDLKRQTSYTGQTVPKIDFDDLKERYQRDLVQAKRREWCVVCLNPSRYHCCWNTTYCSQKCQTADWFQRHIRSCERRKKPKTD